MTQVTSYLIAGPLPPPAIPTTLYNSLMARLDRLAPIKEIAQIAAAIGREFSYRLLASVAPTSGAVAAGRPGAAHGRRTHLRPW